ncbi:hypothetical protein IC617_16655 [Neiella sp. HB171785]|uniref:Glyoxalase/fosfomycin resistance/dioxygenase domain-containing protein n=1 Tax=Neiella litorisoli TaxID=2771431 RepID=A0A8J6R419_9GAMM|nr:VOC family protein [Neiella litorisoli]MBD1391060.1 hypothetical protein [Neiella litorisoli]
MSVQFDHFNISAPMEVLLIEKEFFHRVFGFAAGSRPQFAKEGYWLYNGEQAVIHLSKSDNHSNQNENGYLDHIAFRMTGLASLLTTLEELKVPFRRQVNEHLNMTQVFFKSPAGVGLEANFVAEFVTEALD